MTKIRKLLIANRGEIACRVIRTARVRGLTTVAVYSDADADARHVRGADEAYHIGGPEPAQSYLNIEAVIGAAKASGADAVHPGYGFLSERAEFARACADAGLIFVGPSPEAIAAMGDKASSKELMIEAGVPCVPGYQGADQSDATFAAEAMKIGFPIMVKASAGGGGRGMRVVEDEDALGDAIKSARQEAESAFGDGRLLLERAVIGARHVEVQVFADAQGNCIHLGERDCSLQRRNQKVIEEAPSPVIDEALRAKMGEAAVSAAKAVRYQNAGTVEFLFDPKRREFYFLEMNTRLQVEHPVTECITGLDLVDWQLDIAQGKPLPLKQADVPLDGWAMEARLYAEDPEQAFMPFAGEVTRWDAPSSVRIDTGVEQGDVVSAHYDPMIAKVIAHGRTRDEARLKLSAALSKMTVFGFAHNRDFLVALLEDEMFAKGEAATNYIESNLDRLAARGRPGGTAEPAIIAALLVDQPFDDLLTGWNSRGAGGFPLRVQRNGGETLTAEILMNGLDITAIRGEESVTISVIERSCAHLKFQHEARTYTAAFARHDKQIEIDLDGVSARYLDLVLAPAGDEAGGDVSIKAPMAGLVTSVRAEPGDAVAKGQTLITIEAMKMEHQLKAQRDGVIAEVLASEGDQVAIRAKLIILETED